MFRKTARVESLGAFGQDFRLTRTARHVRASGEGGEGGGGVSYFLDGARKLDVRGLLERVANTYAIDPDPSSYFFEAIRANTTNAPNENNDGFHQSELLRFDVRLGMPVYMTYAGKPHHLNHRCFVAGTTVVMSDGTAKRIEDVVVGDKVLDRNGRIQTVEAAWNEGVPATLTKLSVKGYGDLLCTSHHNFPVWAWPRLCSCGCGEEVKPGRAYKRDHYADGRVASALKTVDGSAKRNSGLRRIPADHQPHQRLEAGQIRKGDYLFVPVRRPDLTGIDPSADRARLLGYYVAEGCRNYKGTSWCFGAHEQETWVQDVESICAALGVTTRRDLYLERGACTVRTIGAASHTLQDWLLEHGGRYSHEKRLSAEVMNWSLDAKKELVRGLFRGDGSQHYRNATHKTGRTYKQFVVAYTTVSEALASQVRLLLAELGAPSTLEVKAAGERTLPSYVVRLRGQFARDVARLVWGEHALGQEIIDSTAANQSKHDGDFILVPVTAVETVPNNRSVYNLTVSGDHSYLVAGGLATFNTENPKAARGVIIDAHYNAVAPPVDTCPSCHRRTADRQNRDASGLHCKCGALVKDEFVEILVGIDAKKDPLFAEGVRKGTLRAGSMGCFLPGTGITMADGTRQAIETIRPGDRIVTHTGKIAEVAETSVHEHEDDVYRVEVQGVIDPIVATGNHPFWVVDPETGKGTWTEADQLRAGQYLRCPAVRYETTKVANDFARLVGYFVSEGNFIKAYDGPHKGTRVGLEFTFSSTEQHYVDEVVALLKKYGNSPNTYARSSRNTITVKDYRCADLTERMFSLVGQHAVDKTLSSEILAWPREAQLHFIGTWLNGDGYSIHDGGPEKAGHSWSAITTSSEHLRDQLSQMLCNLGVPHRIGKQPSSFSSRTAANITIIGNAQLLFAEYSDKIKRPQGIVEKKSTFADGDGLLRRVRSVTVEQYEGPVYNFEVADEDHSYVAGGVAVHNCNCLSTVCNVCQHVAYSKPEFCEHIRAGNKGSLWRRKGNVWVKTSGSDITRELARHKLKYVPNDFCYVTAPDFEARRAFEYCAGVIFDEYSRVDQPADPKALQVEVLTANMLRAAADVAGGRDVDEPTDAVSAIPAAPVVPDGAALHRETAALIQSAAQKEHRMTANAKKRTRTKTAARFVVVRVNADDRDTFAAASLEEALDLAQADESDKLEYGVVEASDAGAARLMKPDAWSPVGGGDEGGGDEDGLEMEGLNIHLEEGDEPVVIEPPGSGQGAPAAPGAPGPGPGPENIEQYTEDEAPLGAPTQDEQMDMGEMGVLPLPPGASRQGRARRAERGRPMSMFKQAYAGWRVQVSEQGNARLLTAERVPVLLVKAKKATQDPEARAAFGREILGHLLSEGIVSTARRYSAIFSPKFAQVVSGGMNDMAGFDDHEMYGSPLDGGKTDMAEARAKPPKSTRDHANEGDVMSGDVRGKPPADVAEGGAMDHAHDPGPDSAVGEDHETMREKRKPFSMGKNTSLDNEMHTHTEPLSKKSRQVEARCAKCGSDDDAKAHVCIEVEKSARRAAVERDAEALRLKRLERIAEAKLAKAEAVLKRAKAEAEAEVKVAAEAAVVSFCRALRIAAKRQAADMEVSPLKQAAEAVLSEPRAIGKDAATGAPIEYRGLDPELTRYLVAELYSIGHDDHLEQLVRRARELTQKGDQYLIDAESDLRNVRAAVPQMTNARVAEVDEVGLRALELRARAQEGNLQFNPAPSEGTASTVNGHDRRVAIRGALGGTLVGVTRDRLGLN